MRQTGANHALEQAFLNDLDEKLWSSADKLRQLWGGVSFVIDI